MRPHPGARRIARCLVLLHLAFGAQLLAAGNVALAVTMFGLAIVWRIALRHALCPAGSAAPRRLLLAADGRVWVLTVGGQVDEVRLRASSLRLGSCVLLVAQGVRRYHLLLGADNVESITLAALRRRLRQARGNENQSCGKLASRPAP